MNEDDLRALVSRAREAEDPLTTAPPGLVDEARRAARRRTRALSGAGAAVLVAAVLVGVAAPRLVRDDRGPAPDGSPVVSGSDELAEHGGPCPATLPAPVDDPGGHGFGTSTPAERAPRLAAPDTAWVCQYGAFRTGSTVSPGARHDWALSHTPRRIDDVLLSQVTVTTGEISADRPSNGCLDDLGPRYLLVTSSGGDLTGIAVDDYGCQDVRLTDDPFAVAPGDPQSGGGTAPGVFSGPDDFAGTVERWWETSPADGTDPDADVLRVTCTDDGPRVDATTVTAGPAGVRVVVESTMTAPGSYLTYTSDGPSGGDRLDHIDTPTTYAFPPGEVTLGCASPPVMDDTRSVTVDVVDPEGYWRDSVLGDYGCDWGAEPAWAVGRASGSTAREAVDALLAQLGRGPRRFDYDAEPAPTGYAGSDFQTWVGTRDGTPYLSILVAGSGTTYTAGPDVLCRP